MAGEILLFGVIGLAVGSFLTLFADRYDTAESVWVGRSHCNHCKKTLTWWELIPLLGFFIIKGRCSDCSKAIPRLYPFFELITAATFILIRLAQNESSSYLLIGLELTLASVFLILFFYDIIHHAFPLPLLILAAVVALIVVGVKVWTGAQLVPENLTLLIRDHALGAVIGGLALGVLAFPSKGTWMGYGDVILSTIIGLWVGYPSIIVALLVAFYTGAFVGAIQLLTRKVRQDHRIAFGPFLIVGAFFSLLWGEIIIRIVMGV